MPWYAPARVFATLAMGRNAVANNLQFDPLGFVVGLIVVVVLAALLGLVFAWLLRTASLGRMLLAGLFYGLTIWASLQYFVLPLIDPLISDKGFPPFWYAVAFAL